MANALGTLSSALIVQESLAYARKILPALMAIGTDFSSTPVVKGQSIKTRIQGAATVNDFGTGPVDVTTTDVDLPITNMKEVHEKFTYAELSSTNRKLIQERAEPIGYAIASHIVQAYVSIFTKANGFVNETLEPLADVDDQTLIALREALTTRGVPGEKSVLLPSTAYSKLLAIDALRNASVNTNNDGTITDGVIRGKFGFKGILEYPDFPALDGGKTIGVALSKAAGLIAVRPPMNPEDAFAGDVKFPGRIGYVSDENGFTVMVNEWIKDDLSANIRMVFLYGVAKGDPKFAQVLATSAR